MINRLLNVGAVLTLAAATVQMASATVTIPSVPDSGSSAILLAISAAGITVARRFFGKK